MRFVDSSFERLSFVWRALDREGGKYGGHDMVKKERNNQFDFVSIVPFC